MTAMVDIVFFLLILLMVTSMQGLSAAIGMPPPPRSNTSARADMNAPSELKCAGKNHACPTVGKGGLPRG
jgi:biopolymer transport protein ExbD